MNKRYKVGIIISILLLLFNQIYIQYWLEKKKDDSKEINIAGKQRMLSQQINLGFYRKEVLSGKLRKQFTEWKKVNEAFLVGDEKLGISKTDNGEVESILTELGNNINFTEQQLIKAEKGEEVSYEALFQNQAEFLKNMDKAVKLLEFDSNQTLFMIKITEIALMLFSMMVLILEVILIYRPINQVLEKKFLELKEKNEEVEKNNLELKRLNDSLEEFAFITAHDLSEPVRKVSIFTNELAESLNENDRVRTAENIKILNNSSLLLKSYFNGVLSLNAIDEFKTYKNQKIKPLVEYVKETCVDSYPDVDCELEVLSDSVTEILFDKDELKTLFYEIVKNSFVYRIKNKPLKIIVETKRLENGVEISFQDNGIGVDFAFEHKVYQMFQRLHGKNEYEGYGIGLALCKRIVETHGGELYFDKTVTNGARLVIRLDEKSIV